MIRAFLFDLDGVLTDTSEFHYLGWKRLADEEGISFDRADNEALRGVSRRESLEILLKGRKLAEPQMQEWMERKNRYYVELIGQMTPANLLPGSLELLAELREAKIKIAIVSSSKNAAQVMDRLKLWAWVDLLVDGSSGLPSKPAPDLFLRAAEGLELPPAECLVIEDAAAGIDAGLRGGMHTLGLGPRERVGAAELVYPSLEGLRLGVILSGLKL